LSEGFVEVMPGVRMRAVRCTRSVVVTETLLQQGAAVPRHSHQALQITFCVRGKLRLRVGGSEHILEPGSYIVIEPGTEHEAYAIEETLVVDVNAPLTEDRRSLVEKLGASCE
jgi:quercetin dioxygenase-like cupin family protein